MAEKEILFDGPDQILNILGRNDERIGLLEKEFNVKILPRGNRINLSGNSENVLMAETLVTDLKALFRKGTNLSNGDIEYAIRMVKNNNDFKSIASDNVYVSTKGKKIKPKTLGQKKYIDSIRQNDLVVAIGPAGTGKTYLAVAMALNYLMSNRISRIILTRPAVEAGEKLGFLPGDFKDKVNPYLRPVYDALFDMLSFDVYERLFEKEVIEIAPIAYMRGRTLNDSFIILDEAQNTTREQMKMFLTRIGFDSKVVVEGDITQIDIGADKNSGLIEIQHILKGIEGIELVYLTDADVMRHKLVSRIIQAYQKHNNK